MQFFFKTPFILLRPSKPTSTAAVIPALVRFMFRGVSEYLEDLMAWIDAPWFDTIRVEIRVESRAEMKAANSTFCMGYAES